MAFRYSGTNWEGRSWRTAGAITTLGRQIEQLRPGTYPTDGTVASQAHDQVNPSSDHRPDTDGIVRAIDWHETTAGQIDEMAEAIRRSQDSRLKYLIHDRRMFSSYPTTAAPAWTWRPYGGAAPHGTHAHLSVLTGAQGELSHPWQLTLADEEEDVEILKRGDEGFMVAKMQKGLNGWAAKFATDLDPIAVDQELGPITEVRLKAYQTDSQIPNYTPGVCGGITFASLMEYVPDWIDSHTIPSTDGISKDEADSAYAPKDHGHKVTGAAR